LNYIPVSQNLHFYIHQQYKFDVLKEIVHKAGKKYSIHGEITSPFDYFMDFLGHQNALMELLSNPVNAHRVLKHFTLLIKELADEMSKTGIDAIKISSPFAGSSFISPDQYLEFVLPFEKEIVEAVRKNNIHAYLHTCGAINDRLESMFDSGASGIECLDPKPLGDVDLSEAVARIGARGFIKGNIDSVNLLLDSTPGEIERGIKEIINEGSKSRGFILSTACSIAPGVKKENIMLIGKLI
jgi:uroporphyrinogen decarboxylase